MEAGKIGCGISNFASHEESSRKKAGENGRIAETTFIKSRDCTLKKLEEGEKNDKEKRVVVAMVKTAIQAEKDAGAKSKE